MQERPIFEEVISSQTEILEAEQRLRRLERELGEDPTPAQLAACGRARDAYEAMGRLHARAARALGGSSAWASAKPTCAGSPRSSPAAGRCASRSRSCSSATPRCSCSTSPRTTSTSSPSNGSKASCAGTRARWSWSATTARSWTTWSTAWPRSTTARVTVYRGNYSAYLRQRAEAHSSSSRPRRPKQRAEIAHLEAFVERFRYKATKAKQAQDRLAKLERIKENLIVIPEERKTVHFNFQQPPAHGRRRGERWRA